MATKTSIKNSTTLIARRYTPCEIGLGSIFENHTEKNVIMVNELVQN